MPQPPAPSILPIIYFPCKTVRGAKICAAFSPDTGRRYPQYGHPYCICCSVTLPIHPGHSSWISIRSPPESSWFSIILIMFSIAYFFYFSMLYPIKNNIFWKKLPLHDCSIDQATAHFFRLSCLCILPSPGMYLTVLLYIFNAHGI